MGYRFLCVVSGVIAVTSAIASFDLMLIPDTANNRILRYDPVAGISLGQIAYSAPRHVAAVAGDPMAVVTATYGTRQLNYSTGERGKFTNLGTWSSVITGNAASPYLVIAGTQISILNSNLGLVGSTALPAGVTLSHLVKVGGGRFRGIGRNATGDIVTTLYDSSYAQVGSASTLIPASSTSINDPIGQPTYWLNNGGSPFFSFVFRTNASNLNIHRVSMNDGFTISATANQSLSGFFSGADLIPSMVTGHNAIYCVGTNSGGTGLQITEFAAVTSLIATTSTTISGMTAPTGNWGLANVVAPEPEAWAALSLGLAALMCRRKK